MIPYLIALSIIIWLFLSPSGTQQDSAPTKKRKSNAPAVVATAVTIDTLIAINREMRTTRPLLGLSGPKPIQALANS